MNERRERRPSRPERGRPAPRKEGPSRPPQIDPARQVAFDVLRAVREKDAYANLVLPELLRNRRITGRGLEFGAFMRYARNKYAGVYKQE